MAEINRRDFLKLTSAAAASFPVCAAAGCVARPMAVRSPYASAIPAAESGTLVNDIHSRLNATRVAEIVKPPDVADVCAAIARARAAGRSVSIAGGRHAMGGQQFGEAAVLIDTRALN